MATDYSHGWTSPLSLEAFKQQYEQNSAELYAYYNAHIARYRAERDTAQKQLATSNEAIDSLEEQVTQLNLNLNIARAGHTSAIPSSTSNEQNTASSFRSEKFPDPEKFNGTRAKLPGFLTQLRMKLEVNHDRFRNESAKVIYSISRLEGRALDQVVPLVNSCPSAPFSSVNNFIDHLEASFGDPDPRGTARRELVTLKQGNGDFATYYSKFLRVISYLNYNESAKIDALTDGLSDGLKDALIFQTETPTSLESYAKTLMTIDNRIRGRKAEQSSHRAPISQVPNTNVGHPSHIAGGVVPMDLSALLAQQTQRPPVELRYTYINGARRTTPAEKQWRRTNNLCMYCAGAGHASNNCPTANRPRGDQATMTAALVTPETTINDNQAPQIAPAAESHFQ